MAISMDEYALPRDTIVGEVRQASIMVRKRERVRLLITCFRLLARSAFLALARIGIIVCTAVAIDGGVEVALYHQI